MPEFNQPCDVYQGFNFKKDKQVPVGFLTELNIGGTAYTADITAKDPTAPTTDLKAVAVLSAVNWSTGTTDGLYFSGQVQTDNKQKIKLATLNSMTNIEVLFKFKCYHYDPKAKKYFLSFHCSDTQMKGLLEKNGNDLNLMVSDDPSSEVQSPRNFAFSVGIKPQPTAQSVTIAVADQMNVVKQWGVTEG